ncbi:MAG: hypothetical protein K2Z80_05085 [Xanthobacteraceae bacterium]|nr:hypothetical protein [Xanthobacteraceae bacterium]
MNRRTFVAGLAANLPLASHAQSLLGETRFSAERGDVPWGLWQHQPSIVVVSDDNDPRLKAVHEAVGFWNAELSTLRSWLQLGAVYHVTGLLPANDFHPSLRSYQLNPPQRIREVDGDIVVALAKDNFNAFALGWPKFMLGPLQPIKVLIGIPGEQWGPMTLPGGARNIVAHELGHAIGLGHNQDPNTLMCGSATPSCGSNFPNEGFRPLTSRNKTRLIEMYSFTQPDYPLRQWQGDPPLGPGAG